MRLSRTPRLIRFGPFGLVLVAALFAASVAAAQEGLHPAGTRTGVPAADRVLDAIEAGQPLTSVLQYREFACVTGPVGEGGPPICPDSVPEGTLVPAVFAGGCSGNTYAKGDSEITRIFAALEPGYRLYGLARYTGDPAGWGTTHVLLVARSSAAWDYHRYFLGDEGIIGSAGCAGTAAGDWADETQPVVRPYGEAPGVPSTGSSAAKSDDGRYAVLYAGWALVALAAVTLGASGIRRRA